MAADTLDLEALVHLEQTFYDAGYTDGFAHGRIHGLLEGRALGRAKGFEIWEEIGFYQGFAATWDAIYAQRTTPHDDQSRRAVHHIQRLLDLIHLFPTVNPSATERSSSSEDEMDMPRLQRQIRSRYKALCASLDVRPTLRAGAGIVSEGAHAPAGSHNPSAKGDVWALENRPTVQELSF